MKWKSHTLVVMVPVVNKNFSRSENLDLFQVHIIVQNICLDLIFWLGRPLDCLTQAPLDLVQRSHNYKQ